MKFFQDFMMITTSEDTTLKVIDSLMHIDNNGLHYEFDNSESNINQVIKINDELVLAVLQDYK